ARPTVQVRKAGPRQIQILLDNDSRIEYGPTISASSQDLRGAHLAEAVSIAECQEMSGLEGSRKLVMTFGNGQDYPRPSRRKAGSNCLSWLRCAACVGNVNRYCSVRWV